MSKSKPKDGVKFKNPPPAKPMSFDTKPVMPAKLSPSEEYYLGKDKCTILDRDKNKTCVRGKHYKSALELPVYNKKVQEIKQ